MKDSEQNKLYVPGGVASSAQPPRGDIEYAQRLKDLNSAIEKCADSENVALLLSSCRNAYITLNSLFADLTFAIGGGETVAPINRAADYLSKAKFANAMRDVGETRRVLAQYRKKAAVWAGRKELLDDFMGAANQIEQPERDGLLQLIRKSKSADRRQSWDAALYDVDISEHSELADRFAVVEQAHRLLEIGTHAAYLLCRFVAEKGPRQETLFNESDGKKDKTWDEVVAGILTLLDAAQFVATPLGSDGSLTVSSDGIGDALFILSPKEKPDTEAMSRVAAGVAAALARANYKAYDLLQLFRPNIGAPPMPRPFMIDLTPEYAKGAYSTHPLRLIPIDSGSPAEAPDEVVIGVAHFPLPKEKYVERFRFSDTTNRAELEEMGIRLIHLAAANDAKAIIFPEYSIPRSAVEKMGEQARGKGIVLIAGLEGRWEDNHLINEAAVILPRIGEIHYQRKQKPSGYQEEEYAFFCDGEIKIFNHTPIGSFGVVICSDYLEKDVLDTICNPDHHPDFLFVPARNPYPSLFEHAAIADAVRFYTNIVIANTFSVPPECSARGSIAVAPVREMKPQVGDFISLPGPTNQFGVALMRLSREAIACRHKKKPLPAYFAAPAAMKTRQAN